VIEWSGIKHFTKEEFACPDCGVCEMDMDFVKSIDDIRDTLDMPLFIMSGYRCAKHNEEVDGKPNSAHLRGKAADIKMELSRSRYVFMRIALKTFKRVGIGKTFIHVDIDETLPQLVAWMY
jgi:zinc D-Ala-D-Ala carboxypeptidase